MGPNQMRSEFCHTCFADLTPGEICPRCGEDSSLGVDTGDVLVPGCVLVGKFKVGRLLGRGGFGATYLAWDINLRVRIAIKEFLPRQLAARASGETQVYPYTGSTDAFNVGLEQFLSEARNLAQFRDNPGIISVLDFFPQNGTGYMVMEYLDGSTLEQYLSTVGRLDIPVALQLLIPVADALRACHAVGLIHRDISPDNIFLTSDGRVKVLDFGAARFAIGARSANLSVILKEGYAPFEQYQRNGRQGPWTDIYALTATLYRLLTGDLPVTAPDRLGGTPLPPPSEKGVAISRGLQALLDKGMAIQAEQRYQTIDAFLSDLQAVLVAPDPAPVSRRPSQDLGPIPRDGRRRGLIIAAICGIGLVGGVAGLAMVWMRPEPRVEPKKEAPEPRVENTDRPPVSLPKTSSTSSLESMREYVRYAAQYQIQLRLALTQARGASNSLDKLKAISTQNETTSQLIQTQENLQNLAVSDRESVLNKYMAQVEWLSGHDEAAVDAAVKLEHDGAAAVTIDKGDADTKAQIIAAIDLLAPHVRAQRQKQLTRAAVIADSDRLNIRGSK